MEQYTIVKKRVRIDKRAEKEIGSFPSLVKSQIYATLQILSRDGKLDVPLAKKITVELFEIRIRVQGQWRVLYAYLIDDWVIILSAFQKKSPKAPHRELKKALTRLSKYQ